MGRKWAIITGIAVVAFAVLWANLRHLRASSALVSATQGPSGAPLVKVNAVQPHALKQMVLAPGTVEPSRVHHMRAPFATSEVTMLVGVGDRVEAGQPIAELNAHDMRVRIANLEASVLRAEAALAQLLREQRLAPRQFAQGLQSAELQFRQAEEALAAARRQVSPAPQRLEQARANLIAVQTRTARTGKEVAASRQRLEAAEAAVQASPLEPAVRREYEEASRAYQEAVRRAHAEAQQGAAELSVAQESLQLAELELAADADPPAVRQARSQAETARQALEQAKVALEAGGVLAEQIRSAESDLYAARQTLAGERERLRNAVLKAPAPGTVLSVPQRSGLPAQQDQALAEVGELDTLTLRLRVDEMDIGKVRVGQTATIRTNAYLHDEFTGTVTRVSAQSMDSRASGPGTYFEVQAQVNNQDGRLRSGMNAEARILTDERSETMVVGLESVREEGGKAWVLVVADFRVEVRPVRLGLRSDTRVEVLEGLRAGEQVIVSPFTLIKSLKNGDSVRVESATFFDRGEDP